MIRYLIGPELFWLILYLAAILVAKANTPQTKAMNDLIENLWLWIPAASLLVFGLWWLPSVEKNWLLLRVWIFGLVGWYFVYDKAMSTYGNDGPGIGMSYLASGMFLVFALVAGSVFVKIRF